MPPGPARAAGRVGRRRSRTSTGSFGTKTTLVANWSEIACSVIDTCRRIGITSVAVCSQADAAARHVAHADEAVVTGPAPARESCLVADRLIEAAVAFGAQGTHSGYGVLSENAAFVRAVEVASTHAGRPDSQMRRTRPPGKVAGTRTWGWGGGLVRARA